MSDFKTELNAVSNKLDALASLTEFEYGLINAINDGGLNKVDTSVARLIELNLAYKKGNKVFVGRFVSHELNQRKVKSAAVSNSAVLILEAIADSGLTNFDDLRFGFYTGVDSRDFYRVIVELVNANLIKLTGGADFELIAA